MSRTETIETDITVGAYDYCVEYLLTRRYGDGEYDVAADGPTRIERYSDDGLEPVDWRALDEATRAAITTEIQRDAERASLDAIDRASDPYLNTDY